MCDVIIRFAKGMPDTEKCSEIILVQHYVKLFKRERGEGKFRFKIGTILWYCMSVYLPSEVKIKPDIFTVHIVPLLQQLR
jgi:hypothetical protein